MRASTDLAEEMSGMWYFAWVLGTGLALAFGVLNAMWYEMRENAR
jgi:cytochrome bd-I ubiquinol oxidase subunit X